MTGKILTATALILTATVLIIYFMYPMQSTAFNKYEKQEYWFAISHPHDWMIEEQELHYKFTVKFVGNKANIVVAVKEPQEFHSKIYGLIKSQDFSEKALQDLSVMMYGKVPGVIHPEVFVTLLGNERSLGSFYIYKLETMGEVMGYMRVLKLETMSRGKFYKLEVSSGLMGSEKEADDTFNSLWPIFELSIKSFVFLPY